jgi:hypothetical protein
MNNNPGARKKVQKFKNDAKSALQLAYPVAAAAGDLFLTNNQRKVTNSMVNALGPVLSKLDLAIDRVTNDAGNGINPHIAGPPVAIGSKIQKVSPRFRSSSNSVTITHRESLGYLNLGSATVRTIGVVNPFNPYVLPWLSTISGSYDKYKINRMQLEYIPQCATSTAGNITLAWDVSASDAAVDYIDLMQMHSVVVAPWMPAKLVIPPCGEKYMSREVTISSIKDLVNHGTIFIGANGSGTAGLLFITYSITLLYPQPSAGLSSNIDMIINGTGVPVIPTTPIDGFTLITNPTNVVLPAGTWRVTAYLVGTDLSGLTLTYGAGLQHTVSLIAGLAAAGTSVISSVFVRSNGSTDASIMYTPTYSTLNTFQVRVDRVDPACLSNPSILI